METNNKLPVLLEDLYEVCTVSTRGTRDEMLGVLGLGLGLGLGYAWDTRRDVRVLGLGLGLELGLGFGFAPPGSIEPSIVDLGCVLPSLPFPPHRPIRVKTCLAIGISAHLANLSRP